MLHRPQLFFDSEKCKGCGKCVEVCPEAAIQLSNGKARTNRQLCSGHGTCVAVCPSGARSLIGRQATAEEIFREVEADAIFYQRSGGGITVSGGEPLAQPKLAAELLRLCKGAGFHTTLDTSGFAKWPVAKSVLKHVDLVLYDFKHMDPVEHQRLTGVSNQLILDNAKRIHHELSIPIWARIPIIPGYNDTHENIEATASFIAEELSTTVPVNLNPYHRFGEAKHERLEKPYQEFSPTIPDDELMTNIATIFRSHGLTVTVGG